MPHHKLGLARPIITSLSPEPDEEHFSLTEELSPQKLMVLLTKRAEERIDQAFAARKQARRST